jgi:hypothetical protein
MRPVGMAKLFPQNVLIKAFCLRADHCGAPPLPDSAAAADRPCPALPTPAEIILRASARGRRDFSWRIIRSSL